jgi:hypothetical protein
MNFYVKYQLLITFSASITQMKNAAKFWSENLKGADHMKDLGVDGRIILERI